MIHLPFHRLTSASRLLLALCSTAGALGACVRQPSSADAPLPSTARVLVTPLRGDSVRPAMRPDFGAPDGGAIFGRVRDPSGAPISNPWIVFAPVDTAWPRLDVAGDDSGAFGATGVAAGEYRMQGLRLGFKTTTWRQQVRPGRSDTLLIVLDTVNLPLSRICTAEARMGLVLEIRDSVTDAPASGEVLAIAREGSFVDTLEVLDGRPAHEQRRPGEPLIVGGLHERAGLYDVTVRHPGYEPWRATAIRLERDECHVITRHLVVLLRPRHQDGSLRLDRLEPG